MQIRQQTVNAVRVLSAEAVEKAKKYLYRENAWARVRDISVLNSAYFT